MFFFHKTGKRGGGLRKIDKVLSHLKPSIKKMVKDLKVFSVSVNIVPFSTKGI